MAAKILDGKALAKRENEQTRKRIDALVGRGLRPGLATVLVGEDGPSQIYVTSKRKTCHKMGIESHDVDLPADISEAELLDRIRQLNADPNIHAILVQLPLPGHIDQEKVIAAVDPRKDVDGFNPENLGLLAIGRARVVPCTTLGILRLLENGEVRIEGKEAVIIGRSTIVGRPTAFLMLAHHATVTICHTRTRDLRETARRAEILVVAAGKAEMVRGDWIAEGAAVIDVGINRRHGELVGDVAFEEARERAGWITPVPGGVGPMTIAMLMRNTAMLAEACLEGGGPGR